MLTTDQRLTQTYKEMFGLDNIDNTSGNTTLQGDVYVANRFDVFGNSVIMQDASCNSFLYVNGNSNIFNSDTTVNSKINISGSTILNGNVSIGSDLSISGNTNIYGLTSVSNKTMLHGAISIGSSLFVAGSVRFGNNFKTNMIRSINNQDVNIQGDIINFGTTNTNIYIKGTTVNLITNDLKVSDKLITLNIDPYTASAFDDGSLSGIEILSNNGNIGYIKTSEDGTRYKIKAPQDNLSWYIATTDNNNNLDVSGLSVLNSYVTICSLLYVSGITTLQGSTTFNSRLNVSGTALLQGNSTILSNLNISGGTILQGYTTVRSVLTVGENLIINGASTINSTLYISGNTNINGELTISSLLHVNGNTLILGNITINSQLNVSNNTTIEGNTTVLSSINISGNTNINSNTNIYGSIIVSGNTILNNDSTINSQLSVNGTANLNNNISVSSNFNIVGNIISNIPEYPDNLSAKNGGVSLWGLYRTGGIVKIRIDDEAPTLTLLGGTSLSFAYNSSYIDPGVLAVDNVDNNILVYLTGIYTNNSNLLSNNILITGTSTLITQTSSLLEGLYTAKYQASDSNYNTSYIYRNLSIKNLLLLINTQNILLTKPRVPWQNVNAFTSFGIQTYSFNQIFGINPSKLSNYDIVKNSTWTFVIKSSYMYPINDQGNNINYSFMMMFFDIGIDATTWNNYESGYSNRNTFYNASPLVFTFSYSPGKGFPYPTTNLYHEIDYGSTNIIDEFFPQLYNSFYWIIQRDNSGYIYVKILNNTGTELYSVRSNNTYTFINDSTRPIFGIEWDARINYFKGIATSTECLTNTQSFNLFNQTFP
jgi:UDP-3-O-[3-hydroxymyristoyl] glucosamine N-acyltransferase